MELGKIRSRDPERDARDRDPALLLWDGGSAGLGSDESLRRDHRYGVGGDLPGSIRARASAAVGGDADRIVCRTPSQRHVLEREDAAMRVDHSALRRAGSRRRSEARLFRRGRWSSSGGAHVGKTGDGRFVQRGTFNFADPCAARGTEGSRSSRPATERRRDRVHVTAAKVARASASPESKARENDPVISVRGGF